MLRALLRSYALGLSLGTVRRNASCQYLLIDQLLMVKMVIVQKTLLCRQLAEKRHLRLRDGSIAIIRLRRMVLFELIVCVLV